MLTKDFNIKGETKQFLEEKIFFVCSKIISKNNNPPEAHKCEDE